MEPWRTAHATMGGGWQRFAYRPASRAGAKPAHRRRRDRAAAADATYPSAAAGAAVRREWIHGAVLADAVALRARADQAAASRGSLSVLDRADANHRAAARPADRRRGERCGQGRDRLVWRHAHRRGHSS